jgi:hypothetical protein
MPKDENANIIHAVRNEFLMALDRFEDGDQGATPTWTTAGSEELEGAGRHALVMLKNLAEDWITIESLGTQEALRCMVDDIDCNMKILSDARIALEEMRVVQVRIDHSKASQEESQKRLLKAAMNLTGLEDGIE